MTLYATATEEWKDEASYGWVTSGSEAGVPRWISYDVWEKALGEAPKYALFSGGYDSLVLTHYVMEALDGDCVLHLDTTTGIQENQDFVERVCEQYGWPLRIAKPPNKNFEEFAKEWGFPGAGAHSWVYRYLKDHSMYHTARSHSGTPEYHTGVRKAESDRRMETITASETREEAEGWVFVNSIAEWDDDEMEEYRDYWELPTSPVVENIGRSGECWCLAFGSRDEAYVDLQMDYPRHFEEMMALEERVQEEIGTDKKTSFWGHRGLSDKELRTLVANSDDKQQRLCSDCIPESYPVREN